MAQQNKMYAGDYDSQSDGWPPPPAASAGSTADSINGGISAILRNVIRGADADVWRTPDGYIRWGKVEAAIHEIVNQHLR